MFIYLNAAEQRVESTQVLSSDFKSNVQSFFQESYAEDECFKGWFESFQGDVSRLASVYKEREAGREKINKDLKKLQDSLEKITPKIDEIVARFDDYPWQKSISLIEALLNENKLYWSDFSFYSKPLKKFIDQTIQMEKIFWKKRAQSILLKKKTLPVVESDETIVPDEALTKRLKALGFLAKFFDFSKVSVNLSHRNKVALLDAAMYENAFLTYVTLKGQ
jgi:DNA repair exonuclease SbcCD ATPase subunit